MQAAVYYGKGDIRIEDVPVPVPRDGELLLEVHAVGVCGTDAAEWRWGPALYACPGPDPVTGHVGPLIPGHELSGRVVSVGPETTAFVEGSVVACGAGYTGRTEPAYLRRPNLARSYVTVGLQRNGGLAQFVVVPAETCIDVSQTGLTDDAAALAQPMAIAVHSLRRGRPVTGETAVVIGAGGIGVFLIYAAAQLGLRVVVVDLSRDRLEIASRLGADVTIEIDGAEDLASVLARGEIDASVIYEVTGTEVGLASALDAAAATGGRVVLTGLQERPRDIDLRRVTLREVELIGTNAHVCGVDLPEAVRLLACRVGGWGDVAPTAFPLADLVKEGLAPIAMRQADRIKTLIDPWASEPRPTIMTSR